jgi:hypothetical protein
MAKSVSMWVRWELARRLGQPWKEAGVWARSTNYYLPLSVTPNLSSTTILEAVTFRNSYRYIPSI